MDLMWIVSTFAHIFVVVQEERIYVHLYEATARRVCLLLSATRFVAGTLVKGALKCPILFWLLLSCC